MSDIDKLTPGRKPTASDKLTVSYSESITGHRGRVTNKQMPWPKICEKLSTTLRDNITTKQFHRLPEAEQHSRKNRGYLVGGTFDKGERKITALNMRSMLTLDIDRASVATASEIFDPFDGYLAEFEYFAYTTRSHTRERPRMRVLIPLATPIEKGKLAPTTRIIASRIDPEMETVDPVSFRAAQIMYFPSTNSDGEFKAYRNRGRLMDADTILAEFGAWENYNNLPKSPREAHLRKAGDKVQDPREKRGIIGAFCRTHDIHDVIEKYLSDIYEPGEAAADGNDRYSYLKGSGTTKNGAIVYEDGRFLYSHHGTDPCGGRLTNSFDLYRIHTFGDKDKPEDLEEAENDPRSLPSYKAAVAWLHDNDDEVMGEYTRSLYDTQAMADDAEFDLEDEDVAEFVEPKPEPAETSDVTSKPKKTAAKAAAAEPEAEIGKNRDWMDDLDKTENGGIKNTSHNVILILQNDKRFKNALAYNEFINRAVIIRRIRSKQYGHDTGPIEDKSNGDPIGTLVPVVIRAILEGPRGEGKTGWGMKVADRDIDGAIERVTRDNSFHPIRNYVNRCKMGPEPILKKMLHRYWRVADTEYHEDVGLLFMVGAVARIMEPGCKFDFVLILEGLTGIGKTTSFNILSGPAWTGEFTADPHKTDKIIENLQGHWFIELPELTTFLRTDSEHLKALFSATSDTSRLAYGRGSKTYRRQNVFYGTTNNDEYFRDITGNRRYWPVKIPKGQTIDTAGLRRDRDALWAEAREWYRWMRRQHPTGDLPLYLQGDSAKAAVEHQSARMVSSEFQMMQGEILEWLEKPVRKGEHEPGWDGHALDNDGEENPEMLLRETVCVQDVFRHVLNREWKQGQNANGRTSQQIAQVLSAAPGWHKVPAKRIGFGKGVQVAWIRNQL